jgi:hypothetical protein
VPNLPEKGQWKIYHGRGITWTGPYQILTVDFTTKTGSIQSGSETAPLSNITITAPNKFTADYTIGGKTGKIEAECVDTAAGKGSLRIELPYEKGGTVITEFNPVSPLQVLPATPTTQQPCCGPDVTKQLVGLLKTVVEDWNNLESPTQDPVIQRQGRHLQVQGIGLWNIDPLRDNLARIMPGGCGPKNTPCDATVMVCGVCFTAGIVNYVLYGVIEALALGVRVEGDVYHGIYWFGKSLASAVSSAVHLEVPEFKNYVYLGYWEHFWVTVGRAFVDGGEGAMRQLIQTIPGLPCPRCPVPPKPYPWSYTWAPLFLDRRSRY